MRDGELVDHVLREVNDGNPVLRSQAPSYRLRRGPGDLHAISVGHGARGVQHQRDVQRSVVGDPGRLEPDSGQVLVVVQRMRQHVGRDCEPPIVRGRIVLVVEGVYPLFGPHRVRLDVIALTRPGERKLVRRAVGIQAEGRDGVFRGSNERLPRLILKRGGGRTGGGGAARSLRLRSLRRRPDRLLNSLGYDLFDRYLPLDLYDPSCGLRSRSFHYLLHRDFLYDLDDLDLSAAAGGQKDRQDGHYNRS